MFSKLDRAIDSIAASGTPGCEISVLHRGREVYRRREGYTGKERLNMYSLSKPVTVVAALQLYERGKFKLDDRLSDYLPEFGSLTVRDEPFIRPALGQISISDLFTMRAGFSYDIESQSIMQAKRDTLGKCPTREVMKYIAREPLICDPGRQFNYGLGHDVLGALIEVVSDMPLQEYMKHNIFDRLGMDSSTYMPSVADIASLAPQYRYDSFYSDYVCIGGECEYRLGRAYASGGAGLVSTLEDYSKFAEAVRVGGVLIDDATTDLMSTNCLSADQLPQFADHARGYGYGLGVRCEANGSGSTDFGWAGKAGCNVAIDRVHDFTMVYVQHAINSPCYNLIELMPFYVREGLAELE